ncbi:MAG TPA: alpha/beta hydrolase [Cytophagales bacterium]|nr:alpha/beta hydrolase [Cytophagales bacterium]
MRILPLFSLVMLCFGSYCQNRLPTLITGKILNPSSDSIAIGDTSLILSEKGEFVYSMRLVKRAYFDVKYNIHEISIFLAPKDSLEISFDARQFDRSLKFTGNSAKVNYILSGQKYTDLDVNNYFNNNWVKLFSKDETSFIKTIDSLKQLYLRPINAFEARKEELNKSFVFDLKNEVNFGFDRLILSYLQQHSIFTGRDTVLSKSTIDYLNAINLDDENLMGVKNYMRFGNEWLDWKIRQDFQRNETLRKMDNQWLNSAFVFIQDEFKDQAVLDFWLYHYLVSHINNQGVKNLEDMIQRFNEVAKNKEYKDAVNDLYSKALEKNKDHIVKTYKNINGFTLNAHIFKPSNLKAGEKRPAMVYFHGGSWSEGKPEWHFGQSEFGFINIAVEYRTYGRHAALPFEEISDAKSFFRWLRTNANELNIDPNKIVASGNSAGGHLVLCAAMLDTLDEPGEELSMSSKPDLLILNSAVFDLSGWNWFDYLLKEKKEKIAISPVHQIKKGLPPMLIFHGTNDRAVPIETARNFVEEMRKTGNKVEFYPILNAPHELWFDPEYQKIEKGAKKDFLKKNKFL